jgi:hypothetical protein
MEKLQGTAIHVVETSQFEKGGRAFTLNCQVNGQSVRFVTYHSSTGISEGDEVVIVGEIIRKFFRPVVYKNLTTMKELDANLSLPLVGFVAFMSLFLYFTSLFWGKIEFPLFGNEIILIGVLLCVFGMGILFLFHSFKIKKAIELLQRHN